MLVLNLCIITNGQQHHCIPQNTLRKSLTMSDFSEKGCMHSWQIQRTFCTTHMEPGMNLFLTTMRLWLKISTYILEKSENM